MAWNTDVVVIGGGYAGVLAANRLTQRDDGSDADQRTLDVRRADPPASTGGRSYDAIIDYREILADGIRLVVDTVTRIDAAERSVALATAGSATTI